MTKKLFFWTLSVLVSIALAWATWASTVIVAHEGQLASASTKVAIFEKWLEKIERKIDDVLDRVPLRK